MGKTPLEEMDMRVEEYRRRIKGILPLKDGNRLKSRQNKLLIKENKRLSKFGLMAKRTRAT